MDLVSSSTGNLTKIDAVAFGEDFLTVINQNIAYHIFENLFTARGRVSFAGFRLS
jgi:hypothetical protein